MEKDKARIEDALEVLDKLEKHFKQIEKKAPPCIGSCNNNCTAKKRATRVSQFYIDNAS